MTNKIIAAHFKLLGQLLDIYEDDPFKINSYLKAARTIEKLPVELSAMPEDKIFTIAGIGNAIGNKTLELLHNGNFKVLEDLLAKTPSGIIDMLKIKGLGPKKIATIWKDLEIETVGELLYACNENRLMLYKGFGEKTQNSIREAIEFHLANQGRYLFAEIESFALSFDKYLKDSFAEFKFLLTGEFYQHAIIIDQLQWVSNATDEIIDQIIQANNLELISQTGEITKTKTSTNIKIHFIRCNKTNLINQLFKYGCSPAFYEVFSKKFPTSVSENYLSEKELFEKINLPYLPPFLREEEYWIDRALIGDLPKLIEPTDVKGVIHAHSKWSDGANTLREMGENAKSKGYEYLVISDHSQSAFYANGLKAAQILAQHQEIEELNLHLAPFKIFKSIESDILNNGDLDYPEDILASFDLVIASVHSNLKMTEQKAMERVLQAIRNKFTNILGHMTGRLLLSRKGYPLDFKTIIDACAQNNVVIELNANPRRLDMDWHWIDYALKSKVLISIDPDAHSLKGIDDIRYGVLAGQKAGLSAKQNLSSFSLAEMELFVKTQKEKRY